MLQILVLGLLLSINTSSFSSSFEEIFLRRNSFMKERFSSLKKFLTDKNDSIPHYLPKDILLRPFEV